MPDGKPKTRQWVQVETSETTFVEGMEFSDAPQALDFVNQLRKLGDPSIIPIALLRYSETTSVEIDRMPLNPDVNIEDVISAVKAKLISLVKEDKGEVPKGEDAIAWAVRTALEVMAE